MKINHQKTRHIRHQRVRGKVIGTPKQPRLNVFRSNQYIYAQIIDDEKGNTLVSSSSIEPDLKKKLASKKGLEIAYEIGKILAQRAKEAGIQKVVFDRGGYKYHGRVKALAEASRDGGLVF